MFAQDGLLGKVLSVSASQITRITGVIHHTQQVLALNQDPDLFFLTFVYDTR
jgi:hypothetical protein